MRASLGGRMVAFHLPPPAAWGTGPLHSFGESCYGSQMTRSLLEDAFAHHVWATTRLIDRCLALSPEQLETGVPGTYGTIIETMRHLVAGDSDYLSIMTGDRAHLVEADHMDLPGLRVAMENHGVLWSELLAKDIDPDAMVHEVDEDDGYERDAAIGIRLAQALHHGTDHRSQICTALTTLGVDPPGIDVWNFGVQAGRIIEIVPKDRPTWVIR